VLDKRLWLLVLIKRLLERSKETCLSYENLTGNFKDGEIGNKLKSQLFKEFFAKYNPDKEFADYVFK
jgi:hypothetical protein